MYNLLQSRQQKTQPLYRESVSSLFNNCEQVEKLSGNWIYCKRPCNTNCGDGKKVWEVVCPTLSICSKIKPNPPVKPTEACIGNQCPWAGQILPSPTTIYNTNGEVSDCGSGTQKIKTVCSYKLDDKYCARGNCNILGQCSKPSDSTRVVTQYLGCQFSKNGIKSRCDRNCLQDIKYICVDTKGRAVDPKGCLLKFGSEYKVDKNVNCKGEDCKK